MKQVLLRLTEDEYELLTAHASKLGVAASRTATMAVVQMLQRLRMRRYESDPLERGHRLIFKVLDALACKLRDDTGNPLAPEDAAVVIDGARDTLKSALVDAADQEAHVLPLWAESAERAGIDWDTGCGPVQTVLDVQRWAEARELELRGRAKVLAEMGPGRSVARDKDMMNIAERHARNMAALYGIQIDDDPEYVAHAKAAFQQTAKLQADGRLKPREPVIIDGLRVSTDPTDREVEHGPSNPAIWNPDTDGEADDT